GQELPYHRSKFCSDECSDASRIGRYYAQLPEIHSKSCADCGRDMATLGRGHLRLRKFCRDCLRKRGNADTRVRRHRNPLPSREHSKKYRMARNAKINASIIALKSIGIELPNIKMSKIRSSTDGRSTDRFEKAKRLLFIYALYLSNQQIAGLSGMCAASVSDLRLRSELQGLIPVRRRSNLVVSEFRKHRVKGERYAIATWVDGKCHSTVVGWVSPKIDAYWPSAATVEIQPTQRIQAEHRRNAVLT